MKRLVTDQLLLLAAFSTSLAAAKTLRPLSRARHEEVSGSFAVVSIVGPNSAQNNAVFQSITGASQDQDISRHLPFGRDLHLSFMLTDNDPEHLDQKMQRIGLSDAVILVVSAVPEEFENTFESAGGIADLLNTFVAFETLHLCVLVTGMDDPSVNFSQDIFRDMKKRIITHLKNIRYRNANQVTMVPLPSSTLSNILDGGERVSWYSESSLNEFLSRIYLLKEKPTATNAALSILRVEMVPTVGTVATGKILYGSFSFSDSIRICPSRTKTEIKRIWDLNGEELSIGNAGQVVKFQIKSVSSRNKAEVEIGSVITLQGDDECNNVKTFEAKLVFFNKVVEELELETVFRSQSRSKASSVQIVEVFSLIDIRTGSPTTTFGNGEFHSMRLSNGAGFEAELQSSVPLPLESYQIGKSFSRLALMNSNGRVVGLAVIKNVLNLEN